MTTKNEPWYDAEIAPKLAELALACGERGCSFVAAAEVDGILCETRKLEPGYSFGFATVAAALQNAGNVDGLILSLLMHAKAHGVFWQSSLFLRAAEDGLHGVAEENEQLRTKIKNRESKIKELMSRLDSAGENENNQAEAMSLLKAENLRLRHKVSTLEIEARKNSMMVADENEYEKEKLSEREKERLAYAAAILEVKAIEEQERAKSLIRDINSGEKVVCETCENVIDRKDAHTDGFKPTAFSRFFCEKCCPVCR